MTCRPIRPALLAVVLLGAAPVAGQLPMPLAPAGTLRLELGGGFFPTDRQFADGTRRDLGDALTTPVLGSARTPLVGALETRLAPLLGRPASPASLGGVTAVAERQRGVGTIGLAWGISRRLTLSAALPIVSVRTQLNLTHDPTGATLGLNPADAALGSAGGAQQNATYFSQFSTALQVLTERTAAGEFASNPALQALAEATLAEGAVFRNGLEALLGSSPVLPVAGTSDADALLAASATFRDRFASSFGIEALTATPAFPVVPLSQSDFDALLGAPTGFGLAPFGGDPITGLGDMSLQLTASLAGSGAPGDAQWFGAWVHGGATLPTGSPPQADRLLDQGTGDGQLDIHIGGSVEVGRGAFGLRAEGSYRAQLAGDVEARIGARDALWRPVASTTLLRRDPGDVIALAVQPFVRLAPRFAIAGLVHFWRQGEDRWTWDGVSTTLPGPDPSVMNAGTGADALTVGLGLSYSHDGNHRDATGRMPVEAAFGLERTVRSGSGLVDAPLTARVMFRVYKALTRRSPPP